jgi:protein-arginine kinase activator protein McsA
VSDLEKQTISIESELKRELEEFNFKYRRTEYKINISQVCREALKQELEKKRRSLPGFKQKTLSEGIFTKEKNFDESDKPVIPCPICGTEFVQTKSTRLFCSKNCGTTASKRRNKAES